MSDRDDGKVGSYRSAVNCVFDNWQALSMAVEHSFGGQYSSEKAEWLKGVMCEFLTGERSARSAEEVEDYLASLMDQEFDTIVDDGSISQISQRLVDVWHEWKATSELASADVTTDSPMLPENTSENKREISEGREDNIVVADDDGWTLVSRKR